MAPFTNVLDCQTGQTCGFETANNGSGCKFPICEGTPTSTTAPAAADVTFTPQVGIPTTKGPNDKYDFSGNTAINFSGDNTTRPIAEYVKTITKYMIGIVGIIATVVLMFGGVLWLTAGGDSGKVGEAQSWITASITGLLLAIGSYLILATVNPDLVNLKVTGISPVQDTTSNTASDVAAAAQGCCMYCNHYSAATKTCDNNICGKIIEQDCKDKSGEWYGRDQTKCTASCTADFWNKNFVGASGIW